jgi:hypothetical protein
MLETTAFSGIITRPEAEELKHTTAAAATAGAWYSAVAQWL